MRRSVSGRQTASKNIGFACPQIVGFQLSTEVGGARRPVKGHRGDDQSEHMLDRPTRRCYDRAPFTRATRGQCSRALRPAHRTTWKSVAPSIGLT